MLLLLPAILLRLLSTLFASSTRSTRVNTSTLPQSLLSGSSSTCNSSRSSSPVSSSTSSDSSNSSGGTSSSTNSTSNSIRSRSSESSTSSGPASNTSWAGQEILIATILSHPIFGVWIRNFGT